MIRLGLIGAGRWGRNYIRTVAGIEGTQLVRLASRNPASRDLVGPGCTISSDWRALIDAGDIDGIIIATPPALHAKMTLAAIDAGIPALVEKPFTLDLKSAEELRDRACARGARVMVGHTHLFHPAFEELKRRVEELGALGAIHADAGNHGPYRPDVPVLWDWGPHDVAMCLDLVKSEPVAVKAEREASQPNGDVMGETLRLDLTFAPALDAHICLSNMTDKKRRFAVTCERGVLVYDDLSQDKLLLEKDGRISPIPISPELPLQRVVKTFLAAIRSTIDVTSMLNLAVSVVSVLERGATSLAKKQS